MMNKRKNQGYAIVVVLVLLLIGTVTIIMMNRESTFFTKVSGFFSRARKIQGYAESGIALAKSDLRNIALKSQDPSLTGVDRFFATSAGGNVGAFNMGLYFDNSGALGARTWTPRIARDDGDFSMRVFYIPEDPCVDTPCTDETKYNIRLPKRFMVVSEVTNTRSGEVFTVESRIQLKFENFAEISFGINGAGSYPCLTGPGCVGEYRFSPGVYGRSHFNLPADKLQFAFVFPGGENVDHPSQMFFFNDFVTFEQQKPNSQPYPFVLYEHSVQQQQLDGTHQVIPGISKHAMMNFSKGYEDNTPLTVAGNEPSSDTYFNEMATMSNTDGRNFASTESCPGNGKPIDICLKMVGDKVKRYNCNYIDVDDRIMGRIDKPVHPASINQSGYGYASGAPLTSMFSPGMETSFPDRYVGERTDVTNGSDSSIEEYPASGVMYCHNTTCGCNIHVKGIVDGQVTFVATDITIEGDIAYQNQDPNSSNDTVGIIAKNNVIIPPGVPQAATTASSQGNPAQKIIQTPDYEPPFTDNTPGGQANNLAEAYLGITNFIPFNTVTGQYESRNAANPDYTEFANWDLSLTDGKMFNSPSTLDLDANIYAGNTVKIDGIFNPEVSTDGKTGIAVVTCEDPPACTDYKYRNFNGATGTGNSLYNPDGSLVSATTSGKVQPLYYANGLNTGDMWIDQTNSRSKYAQFLDLNYNQNEEIPRALNRGINVFGGINSKFHFIFDEIKNPSGSQAMRLGFKRKVIQGDPRAKFMAPPGYPSTVRLRIDELYQKFHQGKSALIPTT
jgi:hypothetical protein